MPIINAKATAMLRQIQRLDQQWGLRHRFNKQLCHVSGYQGGFSPWTDQLPEINDQGVIIGSGLRQQMESSGRLHPTVHLLLFDQEGRIFLQKRSSQKASSAGLLSQSVGGHVPLSLTDRLVVNEGSLLETLKKESLEELGLTRLEAHFLASFPYVSAGGQNRELVFLFAAVYCQEQHEVLTANFSEVEWVAAFPRENVAALLAAKPFLFAPSFRKDWQVWSTLSSVSPQPL